MSEFLSEKIERLQRLDEREVSVLNFIMANPSVKIPDVAKKLLMGESTTRNALTSIFIKLEVPNDERDKRGFIVREYSEAYREQYLKVGQIPSTPTVPPQIQATPPKRQINRTVLIVSILGGFLLVAVVVIAILISSLNALNRPTVASAATEPVNQAPVIIPTDVVISEPTNQPTQRPTEVVIVPEPTELPTSTSVPPTNTPKPQPTPRPTDLPPAIPLPFKDNFSSGVSSNWKVQSGDWMVANGRYTISNRRDGWKFVTIDSPTWVNYSVKTYVLLEDTWEGEVAIVLRYLSSQSKYLVFRVTNVLNYGAFSYWDGQTMEDIVGWGERNVPMEFNLEVIASGNTYTAKINGMVYQTVSISGYDQGGVGLGISCYLLPCASFSDFEVVGQ